MLFVRVFMAVSISVEFFKLMFKEVTYLINKISYTI